MTTEEFINSKSKIQCPVCKKYIEVTKFYLHIKERHKKLKENSFLKLEEHDDGTKFYYSKCSHCNRFVKSHRLKKHLDFHKKGKIIRTTDPEYRDMLPNNNKHKTRWYNNNESEKVWTCGEKLGKYRKKPKIIYNATESNRRKY